MPIIFVSISHTKILFYVTFSCCAEAEGIRMELCVCSEHKLNLKQRREKYNNLLYWRLACLQAKPQAEERMVHQPVVLVASMSTS